MNYAHNHAAQLFRSTFVLVAVASFAIAILSNIAQAAAQAATENAAVDYGPAIEQLNQAVEDELQRGILTGLSVAMVDGQRVVLTTGFGLADKQHLVPATADTVYRVGSISKLFTALATLQLVEQGKLDLDAPIQQFLPDFHIVVPFADAPPITLRQLMCHRSGLVRESPVGGYLDDSQPSIAESIASLESCVLVNPPNTKTRYSNIGVTVVGQAVAAASGRSFEQYQRANLLDPIGMAHSSWRVDERIRDQLAVGYMRVADGQGGFFHQPAPPFELGTIPAGNLYSNVNDMALFAKMLLAKGAASQRRIVTAETLAQMSTPQLTDNDTGFGMGFFAGKFNKHRTIQHSGAVYGFSTSIVVLPEKQIAVVVLANGDIVNSRVRRISDAALHAMLTAKTDEPAPEVPATVSMETEQLSALAGQFESAVHWAELQVHDNQLVADIAGQPMTARPIGPLKFELEGRYAHRGTLEFKQDKDNKIIGFRALDQDFTKVTTTPPALPTAWHGYLGSYGPAFIPLVISVHHGHLYAMTENMVDYRLTPVNATVFKMPEGLYADEHVVFERDAANHIYAATLANMTLRRRSP